MPWEVTEPPGAPADTRWATHWWREQLAIDWVLERSRIEREEAVVRVVDRHSVRLGPSDPVSALAATATVITNRSGSGRGVCLVADGNDVKAVAGGMSCASGSSIVVVEHPMLPLEGWAMELSAVDLTTMKPTPDTRTEEQRRRLTFLASSIYNGWSSAPAKSIAAPTMRALAESGLSWATFAGSILAMAPSDCDLKDMVGHLPHAWREEMSARRERLMRPV